VVVGLSIGELEAETRTPASALRFYERKGLLPLPPRVSGKRRYPPEAADRVRLIRMWQDAGFSLREIAQLLHDRKRRDSWKQLVRTKIDELAVRQSEVERARQQLEHALLCRAPDWTTCPTMRAAANAGAFPLD
jgi:DNA-binding transcriptional MerR regulator